MQVLPVLLVVAAAVMKVDKSESWNFREKSWCWAQVVWQSQGAHSPKGAAVRWDGKDPGCCAECPAMGLTLLMFVPSHHFWGFCAAALEHQPYSGWVLTPALRQRDEPSGRGKSSRDGLLGGWWDSKPRFVLFRWMESELGWQLAAEGNLEYQHRFLLSFLAHLSTYQSSGGLTSSIEKPATAIPTVSHRDNRIYW